MKRTERTTLDEKALLVPTVPTWAKEHRLDELLKRMVDRESADFGRTCEVGAAVTCQLHAGYMPVTWRCRRRGAPTRNLPN